jgi:RNA polymerase sigma-70 factor (ECF subfamily)
MQEDPTALKAPAEPPAIESLFRAQRPRLWGLAYRLTGSSEDADDAVQDAFSRLLASGLARPAEELRRWLVRVTTNRAIDLLRRRRRRAYTGPWLPAAVEATDAAWEALPAPDDADPERRYGRLESATLAFLVALEALGPRQRAALLLRDVAGYSAPETVRILGGSEGALRVLHLRARRAMEAYDVARVVPDAATRARTRAALERFLAAIASDDPAAIEAALAESVVTTTDSAGEFTALPAALAGRARVARLYRVASQHRRAARPAIEIRTVNAMPAIVITLESPLPRMAPRTVLACGLDGDGRIAAIHALLARRKLAAVAPHVPA